MQTIGITGTKGKSTTSSLIYKVLKDQDVNAMLLGNIGIPVFDYIDTLQEDTTLVLEMSSHQLEFMHHSPNIAILLNIFAEHLDHYTGFEAYAQAKCNIYKYQNKNDHFLYNIDNKTIVKFVHDLTQNSYKVSLNNQPGSQIYLKDDIVYFNGKPLYHKNEPRNLMGEYNLNNIMFVLGVSEILNLDLSKTIKSINEFKTLSHRLEFVGKYDDVLYYDNSIATIPMATIEAIKALKEVDTLIIGGMDRGIDYQEFIDYLNMWDKLSKEEKQKIISRYIDYIEVEKQDKKINIINTNFRKSYLKELYDNHNNYGIPLNLSSLLVDDMGYKVIITNKEKTKEEARTYYDKLCKTLGNDYKLNYYESYMDDNYKINFTAHKEEEKVIRVTLLNNKYKKEKEEFAIITIDLSDIKNK